MSKYMFVCLSKFPYKMGINRIPDTDIWLNYSIMDRHTLLNYYPNDSKSTLCTVELPSNGSSNEIIINRIEEIDVRVFNLLKRIISCFNTSLQLLHLSAKINTLETIQFLINNDQKEFALVLAVENHYTKLVGKLINQVKPDKDYYNDLLRRAVNAEHVAAIPIIVGAGADIHIIRTYEIYKFIKIGNVVVIKALIDCSPGLLTKLDLSDLLDIAIEDKHIDILKYLIDKGSFSRLELGKKLITAAQSDCFDAVKVLYEKGAYIHTDQDAAIIAAAKNGNLDMVKFLVSRGACVHAQENQALVNAALLGHIDVVKFLVQAFADIHAQGNLAFKYASINEHADVLNVLKAGCQCRRRDKK